MKKTFCDRCGKEFVRTAISNVVLPYYRIEKWLSFPASLTKIEVDLCKDCQSAFVDWIRGGKEKKEDGEWS